ncbi:DNA translocase FtsK [Patescibacteria group bacterium]|nr:DNA translocase FtsK [Patescibacteria group bacterium]
MAQNRKKIKKINKTLSRSLKIKRLIFGTLLFLISIVIILSFFDLAGVGGRICFKTLTFLFGNTVFLIPLFFVILGWVLLKSEYQKFFKSLILTILLLLFGISGIFGALNSTKQGGWLGYILSWPFLRFFGILVTQIIFGAMILTAFLIFLQLFQRPSSISPISETKKPLITRIFRKIKEPKLKMKEITPAPKLEIKEPLELKTKPILEKEAPPFSYQPPPLDLLEADKEVPHSGDVRTNSAIIKKTLENFDIKVEMSGINIGSTVTQYTLKPAEGIKLSKITALSNNLALALASHPIRIEAPIPGKSLVGIEVPNKVRAKVRLRNLIEHPTFQQSVSNLTLVLGRDVSGFPVFADLAKMPHLLVAGSTGTGKTIFLNSLILSLLYRNSPRILKFILVDPKRVEFPVYNDLPHLLSPVILDVNRTISVLKWLTKEMERRFEILAGARVRDIRSFNEMAFKTKTEPLPYIILIIDELADLMAAKGREIESGIVRLAQLARAVGIHLVVATQRPSVEVITGLIKANITSRVTCQVASQIDSRTVLDMAGAEKLLGLGDMLFVSAEILKPKRIQGAYVSEKEVKKIVKWIRSKIQIETIEDKLAEDLEKDLTFQPKEELGFLKIEEDPLYEEAKKVVIEARKASASLLQRKLRIGYARAARLIDVLEERGIVGPLNGAKPRDVYISSDSEEIS